MCKDSFLFRPAILDDLGVLKIFEQGVISAERPFDSTLKPDPISYYNIAELITSPKSDVLVAVYNNKIIASSYVKILEAKPYLKHSDYAYLGFMYVMPQFRGKGINKAIIEEIKKWCSSKDIYELRLDVYSANISAIRAYEKAGFQNHLVNMRLAIK
ncbi:GNAT family N-acetyltransferase [uncultured Maribacter sp.]|uniref:GNAT family N-acetyltransferase n=1 Tax=uncultured Maribacter sp. TaxID=431308 RepID=UPI002627E62F|nr:GNAT family N-acetyltransferase [uncultured Maribacter sp.]